MYGKLTRILTMLLAIVLLATSCQFFIPSEESTTTTTTTTSSTTSSTPTTTTSTTTTTTKKEEEAPDPSTMATPTIYLVGDSTVKTYEEDQYIAGWGQYLSLFFDEKIDIINAAHGGRSSRSFINEGRLYNIDDPSYNYKFSQNGGNSIENCIKEGDFLFIQFGHNDDASKLSSYTSIYDRMVPLGEPDANGIYPVTPGEKVPTTYLPSIYTDAATDADETKALTEIAKYGSEYYSYDCGGTYKWYLKQYIDFARSVGAIPVLITPVARVKFSGSEIIGGAGLHGENFAYVQAVRQLADEEGCLLIDLFAESKEILEAATKDYANYLMALKPNELLGNWPEGYDNAYGNTEAGYTGIEATHYNKYGAYLLAAKVAEAILTDNSKLENGEGYNFTGHMIDTPTEFIDPSSLMSKSSVAAVEALFVEINVTNPNRTYYNPENVVALIDAMQEKGEVTAENFAEFDTLCQEIRSAYTKVNVDDRVLVTNLSVLEQYELAVKNMEAASRPDPTRVVVFNANNLGQALYNSTVVEGEFTLVGTSDKAMDKKSKKVTFTYSDETYSMEYGLSVGGSAKFGTYRYVSFTVDGPCVVTIAVQSSGTSARTLGIVDSSNNSIGSYEAGVSVTVSSLEIEKAGTYSVGSMGSGMYIFAIIIEYFD